MKSYKNIYPKYYKYNDKHNEDGKYWGIYGVVAFILTGPRLGLYVYPDGETIKTRGYTLKKCNERKKDGYWKEITEEEAALML